MTPEQADAKLSQDVGEMKIEIKFMSKTLLKMEKVFEQFSGVIEKQIVANKRIADLEEGHKEFQKDVKERREKMDDKINAIEKTQTKFAVYATIGATILGTIFGILVPMFFNKIF